MQRIGHVASGLFDKLYLSENALGKASIPHPADFSFSHGRRAVNAQRGFRRAQRRLRRASGGGSDDGGTGANAVRNALCEIVANAAASTVRQHGRSCGNGSSGGIISFARKRTLARSNGALDGVDKLCADFLAVRFAHVENEFLHNSIGHLKGCGLVRSLSIKDGGFHAGHRLIGGIGQLLRQRDKCPGNSVV